MSDDEKIYPPLIGVSDEQVLCPPMTVPEYMQWLKANRSEVTAGMRDRTAQTEPLTTGQQIVAWWETTTSASEPADLADKIDDALSDAFLRGQLSTLPD